MEKNEKVSIKYDAFVKAVRPDSKSTEDTVHLEGFIGESSVPDHFRLYSDASLNEFVEIPTDAVLHAIANSKEESPLGGSKLWIKKSAVYTYGNPAMTNRPQASFLDGDLMQGYMDSMYQPDAGAGMGNMGGGISQPITGCVGPVPQTVLCPINSRFCPQSRFICPPKSLIACPSRFCPSKLFCPTLGACPSIACNSLACNPGGGGRPFDANQGMTDQFGGSFNPYFDGDLYQGYMDSMYQPDASAGMQDSGMGNMGGGASQPITGCVQPTIITINPVNCPIQQITRPVTVCNFQITKPTVCCFPTRTHFPPCNFPRTFPWSPICPRPSICPPVSLAQICPTRPIICNIAGGNGPIVSIADCPSFPCPTVGADTRVVNPNPNVGGGSMADPSGGSFNPYFDGDLYQGYMDAMYQPDASGAGTQAMGGDGGMSPFGPPPTSPIVCLQITQNQTICDIRSRVVICNPVSRFVICQTQFFNSRCCITRNGRVTICVRCIPTDFTRFPTDPGPVFNPRGGGIGGGQQFGNDFYGSFDPYSGY
jgi:hypothetical protein